MNSLKHLFLLDPNIIFLNHGSFGACPKPVFEVYQEWQRRLERQPVLFLGRAIGQYDREARQALAVHLHAEADDLVFVPNATHGVNIVARSLSWQPGDEILTSDHEYGACDYTWEFIRGKTGAQVIRQPLPTPLGSPEQVAEQLWAGVTERTRLIFLSHITSPTAARLPVEIVCRKARQAGILTLIDGAHAPGQIDLDLEATGADFYTGNCHKWMLAPKGAAFLHARKAVQAMIEPLVVSWGYHTTPEKTAGSTFQDYLQWTGTRDPAAYLTVPAAIEFMQARDWPQVRAECGRLAAETRRRIEALTGLEPLYREHDGQMFSVALPPETDLEALKARLYDEFCIEVPLIEWNGRKLMRVSIQAYNDRRDADALLEALGVCLATF